MSAKRDNDYFIARLKREHPKIHAELLAGRYRSVRAAALAAGLVKPRPALAELKNAWIKSNFAEKKEFIAWVKVSSTGSRRGATATPKRAFDAEGRLLAWVAPRVREIQNKLGLSNADVMVAMGRPRSSSPLWGAMRNNHRIREASVRRSVEAWLHDNRSV